MAAKQFRMRDRLSVRYVSEARRQSTEGDKWVPDENSQMIRSDYFAKKGGVGGGGWIVAELCNGSVLDPMRQQCTDLGGVVKPRVSTVH
jgi:hypothetical protein